MSDESPDEHSQSGGLGQSIEQKDGIYARKARALGTDHGDVEPRPDYGNVQRPGVVLGGP